MKNNEVSRHPEHDLERWTEDRLASHVPDHDWQPDASRAFARFQQARLSKRTRGRARTWVIGVALATSLSVAAFPATRVFAQHCVSACVTGSSRIGQFFSGSPTPTNVFVKPGDRIPAADFALTDASGHSIKLSDFRGKVVLLNFWATWCIPCGAEIPWFVGFQQQYRDRGFEVLGVSLDDDGWKSVKPYIEARHVNYAVMIGNDEIAQAYGGLESVPMTLIIDKSGRIAATHVGLCRKDEYEADIQAVLNE